VAAARALATDLRAAERDPQVERAALERLAAWAGQFTPMACVDGQGIALEIESTVRLFEGHAKLIAAIRRGIHDLGFRATVGIAPTPLAARLFARAEARGLQVRSCLALTDLRQRLDDLPLFLLDWPGKTLARLHDLGILRLRDAFELPAEGIARRFGPEIALSLGRLIGSVVDPREPHVPAARFNSRLELPAETESVQALLFPLRRMLAEFEGALRGRGAGVQRLLISLEHLRKAATRLELDFSSPEREADFILAIARERLGRLVLAAPAIGMALRADALLPYVPREATWLPGAKEQSVDRERLIGRLTARLGRDRIFGIALANDHRPERNWKKPGTDHDFPSGRKPGSVPGFRPVWLLHRPQRLITRDGNPGYQGDLELLAGPERIEAGWWDGEEVSRDYFVAANPRGETFWVFREHRDPQAWYLHGVFA
jgi:protein ImuB